MMGAEPMAVPMEGVGTGEAKDDQETRSESSGL